MNVILITIDALRFDYGLRLFNLLKKKVNLPYSFYNKHYTNGPITLSSFPAMMTSTPFLLHDNLKLNPLSKTLAQQLARQGYKNIGFNANPVLCFIKGLFRGFDEIIFPWFEKPSTKLGVRIPASLIQGLINRRTIGLLYAFNQFLKFCELIIETNDIHTPYVEGEVLTQLVISKLETILKVNKYNTKFFLWMNYMDCHRPYLPPSRYSNNSCTPKQAFFYSMPTAGLYLFMNKSFFVEKAKELYTRCVYHIYDVLSEFMDFLNDKKIIENSMIIITSDHGEAFGEHGRIEHFFDLLYDETLHVPLFFFHEKAEDRIINYTTDHMGLMPTLFDILGKNMSSSIVFGKSFLKEKVSPISVISFPAFIANNGRREDEFAIAVIKDDWKAIYRLKNKKGRLQIPDIKLFNLMKDPFEKNDIASSEPDVVKILVREGLQYLLKIIYMKRKNKKVYLITDRIKSISSFNK